MDLFKFFKKKNTTQAELTAQFKQILARQKELTDQASEIRRKALMGEAEDYSIRLTAIRDEQELLQAAELQIESMMRTLLLAEIEKAHERLPADRESFQAQYAEVTGGAGVDLGRCLSTLESLGESWGTALNLALVEVFDKITSRDSYAEKIAGFMVGYERGRGEGAGADLAARKAKITSAEKMVPGSTDAEQYIKSRLKVLLYKPAPPAPPEPYRRGGFFRGGIDTERISQAQDAATRIT